MSIGLVMLGRQTYPQHNL